MTLVFFIFLFFNDVTNTGMASDTCLFKLGQQSFLLWQVSRDSSNGGRSQQHSQMSKAHR